MQYAVKQSVKTKLSAYLPTAALSILKIANSSQKQTGSKDFQLIEEGEIRYCGNMYDVAYTELHNDTTYYYCIRDAEEELLFDGLNLAISFFISEDSDTQEKQNNLIKHLQKEYLFQVQTTSGNFLSFLSIKFSWQNQQFSSPILSCTAPPPKQS